ncbi:hypothetical protein FQN53_001579 [Emmonsiellopsis sp. PD_33]|nr:hypothetical protein FQN53_001579 [Emmonsiellopsis sp. PD_33]
MASTTNNTSPSNNISADDSGTLNTGGDVSSRTGPASGAHGSSQSDSLVPPGVPQIPFVGMSYHTRQTSARRSAPVSSTNSVTSSRETSPIRPPPRPFNSAAASRTASRSRKNSQELSPTRGPGSSLNPNTSTPSAAALRRNLSNVNKPQLPPPSTDPLPDLPRPSKSNTMPPPRHGDSSLQWPVSPRLKSPPPPVLSSRNNLPHPSRRSDQDITMANMSSKRNAGSAVDPGQSKNVAEEELDGSHARRDSRASLNRGVSSTGSTLETVQEGSLPTTSTSDHPRVENVEDSAPTVIKSAMESESDSGGNKSKPRIASANTKPGDIIAKRSFTSLSAARGKLGEVPPRNMIIEAETVSSIPQVSLGGGTAERGVSGRTDSGGSIRLKASDETIRPKKEKKKPVRKPTTLPAGTVSSKADIFEAKVASAVDEADSSDSEETFVYDSNPPDSHPARQHRYHSRTPSTTSMASQADQYGGRPRIGLRDAGHNVTGKRSMKFTNNTYGTLDGDVDHSSGRGSGRANGHVHSTRHSHIGRHGRNGGHPSVLDPSPFIQSQSPKSSRHNLNNGGRQTYRSSHAYRMTGSPKKNGDTYGYDFDGEGADDERTPLVGSVRVNRSRHGRRPNSASLRQMEYMEQRQRGCFSRYGFCVIILAFFFLLVGGATTAFIGLMKPLTDVYVKEIQNVLASEQEIMFGLDVRAANPNLMAITINDMDVNIFAKSRFVGSESFWRDLGSHSNPLPRTRDSNLRARLASAVKQLTTGVNDIRVPPTPDVPAHIADGIDEGTDPIPEDPSGDPQTMLLGRIFHFDSPLTFESSPWKHELSRSIGEVRLAKPGNKTEEGGTARWERVLQHPFELIVRGVVKYQLPLTSSMRSASISSKVRVVPNDDSGGDDGSGDKDGGSTPPETPNNPDTPVNATAS